MSNFRFSQTALKDFERDEGCVYKWKKRWLDFEIKDKISLDQAKGRYFEQLLIGSSVDSVATELPLLKNGKKSIETHRIEEQARRCQSLFMFDHPNWTGLTIKATQKPLKSADGLRDGVLDIIATDQENVPWVVDVKLTRDITNDRTEYGWGNDWETLDLIQPIHYCDLYKDNFGIRPRLALLVADYSPSMRYEFAELVFTADDFDIKEHRFVEARKIFEHYQSTDTWPKLPGKDCKTCPLECEKRTEQYIP